MFATVVFAALVGVYAAPPAAAQSRHQKALAQSLFDEGWKLMDASEFAAACEKFQASLDLEYTDGALQSLGVCHERQGKVATAWQIYHELDGKAKRAKFKQAAAVKLEQLDPRVPRIVIMVPSGSRVEGLIVTLGDVRIAPEAYGVATPVDPGATVVRATAPELDPWEQIVDVVEGGRLSIAVPRLAASDAAGAPDPASPARASATESAGEPDNVRAAAPVGSIARESPSGGSARKTVAMVTAGAGVVVLGVSGIYGLRAVGLRDDARAGGCTDDLVCPAGSTALQDARDARSAATRGTWIGAAGVALVAAGAYLWITSPGDGERSRRDMAVVPAIGASSLEVVLRGEF